MILTEEKERVSNSIFNWSLGFQKDLNVITLPHNSADIFVKAISRYIKENKKILYITDEKNNIQLIENIKDNTEYRGYTYLRNPQNNLDSNLVITNFKIAEKLEDKFDLIIYDEINSIPKYENKDILNMVDGLSHSSSKRVFYSVESVLPNKREIILPVKDKKAPMVEPRDIITRIDINKDIPYVVYDYLKWSINNNRNVLIYVPNEEKVEKVYKYIYRYCADLSNSISFYVKDKSDIKIMMNFYQKKNAVMVTDEFNIFSEGLTNTDIMVYFANNRIFSHKILTHLCSGVTRTEKDPKGEAIFVCNEKSENVEAAKVLVRNFNKEAWEMGFLKI